MSFVVHKKLQTLALVRLQITWPKNGYDLLVEYAQLACGMRVFHLRSAHALFVGCARLACETTMIFLQDARDLFAK